MCGVIQGKYFSNVNTFAVSQCNGLNINLLYFSVLQIGLMMSGCLKLDMIQEITEDSRLVKFFILFLIVLVN